MEPEVQVTFAPLEDGESRMVVRSQSFAVFWRDQFGSVHFHASPEDWWGRWFDEHHEDPSGLEHDPDGSSG